MPPIKRGTIVCSKSGRDRGYYLVVVSSDNEYVYACDGKERPLERPKRKNPKHIHLTNFITDEEQMKTNRSIRHVLNDFKTSYVKGEI